VHANKHVDTFATSWGDVQLVNCDIPSVIPASNAQEHDLSEIVQLMCAIEHVIITISLLQVHHTEHIYDHIWTDRHVWRLWHWLKHYRRHLTAGSPGYYVDCRMCPVQARS